MGRRDPLGRVGDVSAAGPARKVRGFCGGFGVRHDYQSSRTKFEHRPGISRKAGKTGVMQPVPDTLMSNAAGLLNGQVAQVVGTQIESILNPVN